MFTGHRSSRKIKCHTKHKYIFYFCSSHFEYFSSNASTTLTFFCHLHKLTFSPLHLLSPPLVSLHCLCFAYFSIFLSPLFHRALLAPSSSYSIERLQFVTAPLTPLIAHTLPSLASAQRRVKCMGFCLKTCGEN